MSTTSGNSSLLGTNSGRESRYFKMKKCVTAIKGYLQNSTEEENSLINRYLQALSSTKDVSIFDPHTIIASEFFISLYELMGKIDPRSVIAWYCVDVLSNACRNSLARQALIKSYQFLPYLSRMSGDQLVKEKRIRLLKLMQDITVGIKISWQIPHLSHLMKILVKWVDSQDDEVVGLSLGILVNLCYKNLPAIYTLTSNVDMKKLLKSCITLKGEFVEAHACKLMVACDPVNEMGIYNLKKIVTITFSSITKALEDHDYITLNQLVEFHIDLKRDNRGGQNEELSPMYESGIVQLFKVVDKINIQRDFDRDGGENYNVGKCMASIFQFMHHLMEIKMDCLKQFYEKWISVSLMWVQNDMASPQAMDILKNIALSTPPNKTDILKPLGVHLPIFLLSLSSCGSDNFPEHSEHLRKIEALLQLLRALLQIESLRQRILVDLKEEAVHKLFHPLIGEDLPCSESSTSSDEAVEMFTHALALVDGLAKYDLHWVSIRESLLQQRPIHYILSQGLLTGKTEMKSLILEMTCLPSFPRFNVSSSMSSIQRFVILNSPPESTSHHVFHELSSLVPSVTQVDKIDNLLTKLQEVVRSRNFEDTSTPDVMELYEYKLASMAHAEKAAMMSVEAASERSAHLQQRTMQLSAEAHMLHHLLLNVKQKYQRSVETNKELEELVQLRTNSSEAEKGRCRVLQSKLAQEEKHSSQLEVQLNELREERDEIQKQRDQLKNLVSKLEENSSRLEKNLAKKEEALRKSALQNEECKAQIVAQENELKSKQESLERLNEQFQGVSEDLKLKNQILETITKVAQQRK